MQKWRGKGYLLGYGSDIQQDKIVIFAGDLNGHAEKSNTWYAAVQGGFSFDSRNTDRSRVLEFADGLDLVISKSYF